MRLFVCVVVAIALMVLGQHAPFFKKWRARADLIVLPIQYLVNWPIQTVHSLAMRLTTQQKLLDDNARLRAHELLLQARLQKLLVLEKENAQLRQLMQSTHYVGGKVVVGQILAVDLNPDLYQVIVDRGAKDHVYIGQPVLDAYGVMGQVVQVGELASKVMLITDSRSAIPVQDYRNNVRAIAVGQGINGKLALINVPNTSDIKAGDLFIASGLGLHYPIGYPVGRVASVSHITNQRFANIVLVPSAHLDQTQQVLLAWPDKLSLAKTIENELKADLPEPGMPDALTAGAAT